MQGLSSLLNTSDFIPHGFCINWTPELLWLYVLSDSAIALAYFSIPVGLIYFVWQRQDLKYRWMFLLFGAFILSCGTTHILSIISLWYPIYWLDASMKAVTASISAVTALMLLWVIPKALRLPSPAQLEMEVQERRAAHAAVLKVQRQLQEANQSLEIKVNERTHELLRQQALYAALSQCNQAIVHCTNEAELFPRICRAAVEFGGMNTAWVGRIDPETRLVRPVASFGKGAEELQDMVVSIDAQHAFGNGPTGTAMREQRPFWCQDFSQDPLTAPWRERSQRAGWAASASLPLYRNGAAIGVFTLYAGEANAFDEAARNLLEEMAADISFALDNFTREAARLRAEKTLLKSEAHSRAVTQSANDAIITADSAGNIVGWNRGAKAIFGYSESEILGRPLTLLMPPRYQGRHDTGMQRVVAGHEPHVMGKTVELEGVRRDRSEFPIELSLARWETADGQFFTGIIRDISARKLAEQKNTALTLRHQVLMQTSIDGIHVMDASGKVVEANDAFCAMLGYTQEEVMQLNVADWDAQWSAAELQSIFKETIGRSALIETVHRRKDGRLIDVEISISGVELEGGDYVFASSRDITERKQTEKEMLIAATAFESQEGIIVTDAHNVILRVNRSFTRLTGYSAEEVIGRTPALLQSGKQDAEFYQRMWQALTRDHYWHGEIWNRRKNGEVYPEWLNITAVINAEGQVTNYIGSFSDITQHKAAESEIEHLAFYDPLTGLPNRRLLHDRLQHALAAGARQVTHGAILFIDLDNFKNLNDTKGHNIGDLLLIEVAGRLRACVREGDTVARLGGDEFIILLGNLSEDLELAAAQTESVGEKILATINQPYTLQGHQHHGSTSIGICLFNNKEITADELLKRADTAMYEAKGAGRNTLRFYDPAMQAALEVRAAMEGDLHRALSESQFRLYFQMQVTHDKRIVGAEVLLRWHHPQHGLVSPLKFIPLAEETGLILPIGQWVLEAACAQLKAWEGNALTRPLQLAVNVSARQFHQADFVDQVCAALAKFAIDPGHLKLELTESLVLDDIDDTIAKMHALKQVGVRFSMDDFGTGYSSLAYLTQLPLNQLKIDQSFVRNIGMKSTDAVIVQTIIGMANNLGMEVIAEGVETEEQRAFLELHDCPLCQGYLFGKPMPVEEFEARFHQGAV